MLAFLTHPVTLLTIGGALGTNARHWLGHWISHHIPSGYFPLATLVINVTGSLLIGLLVVPFRERAPHWYVLFGVGFCGGYTTFSAFALQTVELVRTHHRLDLALVNVVGSVVLGCLVTWFALAGMETIVPPPPRLKEEADRETQTAPKTPPPGSASES